MNTWALGTAMWIPEEMGKWRDHRQLIKEQYWLDYPPVSVWHQHKGGEWHKENSSKKGKTKMEKTYWDEKAGQIVTKGGKCLFDRQSWVNWQERCNEAIRDNNETTKNFRDRIEKIEKSMACTNDHATIQAQLACAAKTQGKHKMVYKGIGHCMKTTPGARLVYWTETNNDFIFKCSVCGLEIIKTEKELSATEKEALKKLKLL